MTLEIIRDDPESFYNGPLAESISQDIRIRIPEKERKGQVTEDDLSKIRDKDQGTPRNGAGGDENAPHSSPYKWRCSRSHLKHTER